MSDIGGSGGGKSGLDTNLQQGAFEFGPSQFDLGAIMNAQSGNQQTTTNRYNQLGMGGSTPELQDLANQANLGQAEIGKQQTADVGNPAFNPALQPVETNLPTNTILGADQAQQKQQTQAIGQADNAAGVAAGLA
jgi:hypothetical protein